MTEHPSAATANQHLYDQGSRRDYVSAAPHLMHESLRALHDGLVTTIYEAAQAIATRPRVLDLGAGEGSVAEAFLRLGAEVVAVDISERQLADLQRRCSGAGDRLQIHREDVWQAVARPGSYDVIVLNSFLHHVPDYLGLVRQAISHLGPGGQLFSFQDPLRYDTLPRVTYAFSNACYFAWRVLQGNLRQGLATRIRRLRGIYVAGSAEDDAEYHVTRNGVDQEALVELLRSHGFTVRLIRYFSTQSATLHRLGSLAGLENTFGIVAQRA